jgi:hypothetical protein
MQAAIQLIEQADAKSKHAAMGIMRGSSRVSICLQ